MTERREGESSSNDGDRLSERSHEMLRYSRAIVRQNHNARVGVTHLLYGVLQEGGDAAQALRESGVTLEEVEDMIQLVEPQKLRETKRPSMTPRLREIGRLASGKAHLLGDRMVDPEHFVAAALTEVPSIGQPLNTLAEIVAAHQVSLQTLASEIEARIIASVAERAIASTTARKQEIATLEEWLALPSQDSDASSR